MNDQNPVSNSEAVDHNRDLTSTNEALKNEIEGLECSLKALEMACASLPPSKREGIAINPRIEPDPAPKPVRRKFAQNFNMACLEDMRLAMNITREAERLFGKDVGVAMWSEVGFSLRGSDAVLVLVCVRILHHCCGQFFQHNPTVPRFTRANFCEYILTARLFERHNLAVVVLTRAYPINMRSV